METNFILYTTNQKFEFYNNLVWFYNNTEVVKTMKWHKFMDLNPLWILKKRQKQALQ